MACDRHASAQCNLYDRFLGCLHHYLTTNTPYSETTAFTIQPKPALAVLWRSSTADRVQVRHVRLRHHTDVGGVRSGARTAGFDFAGPAVLYAITHRELGAHKIGITGVNARTDRLAVHRRHGWEVIQVLHCDSGAEAYLVEQAALRRLRNDLGLGQCLTAADMPQRGETETVDAAAISLPALWQTVTTEATHLHRAPTRRLLPVPGPSPQPDALGPV
ncbi:hypothetical protein ACFU7Y_35600 [Kitasatospora sp. NPDC057542]|uniref:hypothetical protein n=1 Tax=Kitasatospora sp. NPDC057542 TaxID=3346162 RepID=UPI0036A9FFAB